MKKQVSMLLASILFFIFAQTYCATPVLIIPPKPQTNSFVDFTKKCIQTSFAGVALASLGYSSYQFLKFLKYWVFVKSENDTQEAIHEDTKNRSLYRMFAGLLVAMGAGAIATTDFTSMNIHFDVVQAASLLKDALQSKK